MRMAADLGRETASPTPGKHQPPHLYYCPLTTPLQTTQDLTRKDDHHNGDDDVPPQRECHGQLE
jgi:hypothetical protein